MHYLLNVCGIATAAIAFAAFAPSAVAQENIIKNTCQDVGVGPPEPLGDREGHSISVAQFSCRVEFRPNERRRLDRHGHLGMGKTDAVYGFGQRRRPQAGRHCGAFGTWRGKSR